MFQPLHPETGAPLHVKRVISASEMSLLNVITCDTSCCMLVSQSFQGVFEFAWKLENTVPPVIALSFHLSATEDVDHEVLWLASVIKVQILDQSYRQQDCVSAFGAGHWRTVARGACDCSATGKECAL